MGRTEDWAGTRRYSRYKGATGKSMGTYTQGVAGAGNIGIWAGTKNPSGWHKGCYNTGKACWQG